MAARHGKSGHATLTTLIRQTAPFFTNMRIITTALFFLFLSATSLPAQSQTPLVVGAPCLDIKSCKLPEVETFFKELYSRSGLAVEVRYLPMLRDITEADAGIIDATMSRTMMATKDFPNLVRVPFPLLKFQQAAVTTKLGIHIRSWEDLKPYNVGLMRGSRTEYLMAESRMVNITLFNSWQNGFAMLQENRIDVVIASPLVAKSVSRQMGMKNVHVSEPIMECYTYHYINKKHATLAPRLAQSLKEMLEDGTTERLMGRFQSAAPERPLKPLKDDCNS